MVGEERTAFSEALFGLIDADNSGEINFEEFVQVLTTYCIYSQSEVLSFVFNHFDEGECDDVRYFRTAK